MLTLNYAKSHNFALTGLTQHEITHAGEFIMYQFFTLAPTFWDMHNTGLHNL